MQEQGIKFVDKRGRRWTEKAYSRMVATTQLADTANMANIGVAEQIGAPGVRVRDGGPGDVDQPCIDADGQAWQLVFANLHRLQHPHCRRAFAPLASTFRGKFDRTDPPPQTLLQRLLAPFRKGYGEPVEEREVEPIAPLVAEREPEVTPTSRVPLEPHIVMAQQDFHLMSRTELGEWGKEHYTSGDELPEEQLESLERYVASGYQQINPYMRDEKMPFDIDQARSDIENLDSLTRDHPLPETMVVERGVGVDAFGGEKYGEDLPDNIEGRVFEEKAFLSTSLDPILGRAFSSYPVQVRMTVPAGTPSYYVPTGSQKHEEEFELLLGPGRKIVVTSVERGDGEFYREDQWLIDAVILPEEG